MFLSADGSGLLVRLCPKLRGNWRHFLLLEMRLSCLVLLQAASNLQLLPTKKKDVIRVVAGDFQGKMGQCLNMADADAIVKLDDGDMKVMEKGVVGWLYGRTS